MQLLSLAIVFVAIIVLLGLRRPLYQAISGGLVLMVLLFHIPLTAAISGILNVFTNWGSFSILVSLYLVTYLQRILEARSQIKLAQQDLNGLFHNRRVNATGAPMFIGLLPSAAAMILCGDIMKDATEGYLEPKEQAFVTNWIRHIPESTLPTYSGVLLMATLSGLPLPTFTLHMIVPVIVLVLLGYFPYIHRLPKDPGTPVSENRVRDAFQLFAHLWSLLLILVLILVFDLSIVPSILISIVACLFVYRFRFDELRPMFRSAFEKKLLSNTFLVLVLKEFISYTGVLKTLPDLLEGLAIPTYIVFALMFFLGGIISGSNGIIALGTPLAFAAIPDGGVPLMVLLMCMSHAASMVSPTHVCSVVAADYFGISLGQLIRKTIPTALLFCVLMLIYYNVLLLL
ncbi:MAG: DUF401 family protein [Firmicutes bacterium]|nr:DUF401 family protein [Bacillota bacterium]